MAKCCICGADVPRLFSGICTKCISARAIEEGKIAEAQESGGLPDIQINEPLGMEFIEVLRGMKQPYYQNEHSERSLDVDGKPDPNKVYETRYSTDALKRKFKSHWKDAQQLASMYKEVLTHNHMNDGGRFNIILSKDLIANQGKYDLIEGSNGVCMVCLKGTDYSSAKDTTGSYN